MIMSKVAVAYMEELESLFEEYTEEINVGYGSDYFSDELLFEIEEEYKEVCFSRPVWNHDFNKKMVVEIVQNHL